MAIPRKGDPCVYFETVGDWGDGTPGSVGWNPLACTIFAELDDPLTQAVVITDEEPARFFGPVALPNVSSNGGVPVVVTALPFIANSVALNTAQEASNQASALAFATGQTADRNALNDDTQIPLLAEFALGAGWSSVNRGWRNRSGGRVYELQIAAPADIASYSVLLKDHTTGVNGSMAVEVVRVERDTQTETLMNSGVSLGSGTEQTITVTIPPGNKGLHVVRVTTGANNTPNNPALRYAIYQIWRNS